MRIAQRLAGLVIASALFAGTLEAQGNPQTRQGFGISFGIGAGSAGVDCEVCPDDRETGLSGYLRIGGYLRPNLFLAGESNGWSKTEDGVEGQAGFLSAVAQWYPQPASGLFVKGGLGLATVSLEDDVDEITSTGLGITVGGGYDFRVGRNFSLSPYINYLRGFGAQANLNGTSTDFDYNVNLLQFGLGFTWH